jgi:MFS family permease
MLPNYRSSTHLTLSTQYDIRFDRAPNHPRNIASIMPMTSQSNPTRATELTLLLVSTMTIMAGATIAPALPDMMNRFSGVANVDLLVRLVLTIPALTVAISSPWVGILVDRIGRKPVLLASMVLYGLSGTSGLYLMSLSGILVGRAFLGISVAGVMTCGTALAGDYFSGIQRNRFMGLQSAAVSFGGVVILLGGGLLADVGWRAPFAIYLSAFAMIPLVMRFIHEPDRLDGTGKSGANDATSMHDDPPQRVGLLTAIYTVVFLSMVIFYMIPTQIPFYVAHLGGTNGSLVGLVFAVQTAVSGTMALQYRRIRKRLSTYQVFVAIFFLLGAGYALLGMAQSYQQVLYAMVVSGAGLGLLMPSSSTWLLDSAPSRYRGRLVGALTMSLFLGQFVSPLASQLVATRIGMANTWLVASVVLMLLMIVFGVASLSTSNRQQDASTEA